MPEDWEVKKINDVKEKIFSGGTPDTRKQEYWDGSIPWLSSGETHNRFIRNTEKKITELGVKNSSTKLVKVRDVIVASAGQGYTRGQTSFCMIDTYINQSIVAL
ncbi:MAG: restriction endonuclease subunit S, partial [Thaumarchaeota archaeon]|nr:restriction endonuclease subunit S [Nitrososphaerota archaeon]